MQEGSQPSFTAYGATFGRGEVRITGTTDGNPGIQSITQLIASSFFREPGSKQSGHPFAGLTLGALHCGEHTAIWRNKIHEPALLDEMTTLITILSTYHAFVEKFTGAGEAENTMFEVAELFN